ncbi:MAG: Kynureninase, partial [uncultured Lysobacter sp.]
ERHLFPTPCPPLACHRAGGAASAAGRCVCSAFSQHRIVLRLPVAVHAACTVRHRADTGDRRSRPSAAARPARDRVPHAPVVHGLRKRLVLPGQAAPSPGEPCRCRRNVHRRDLPGRQLAGRAAARHRRARGRSGHPGVGPGPDPFLERCRLVHPAAAPGRPGGPAG